MSSLHPLPNCLKLSVILAAGWTGLQMLPNTVVFRRREFAVNHCVNGFNPFRATRNHAGINSVHFSHALKSSAVSWRNPKANSAAFREPVKVASGRCR